MSDNFDYRKDFIRFEDLLPTYFQNDINVSTFSNGINRLLTADDYIYVQGKIGKQIPSVPNIEPTELNLPEDSLSRSTWQLQPLIYSKLGTQEYITSFQDILDKLTRLGVDVSRQDKWLECDQFNFAPPIDVDKFINYRDYFWVENSQPNYITMNNSTTRAKSLLFEIENGTETTTKQASINAAIADRDEYQSKIDYALNKEREIERVIEPKYQWINSNKWVHRSELAGYNFAYPAKLPIIEYYSNLEVNTWTFTKHNWKYRANQFNEWVAVDTGPTQEELLQRYPITGLTKNTFVVQGDVTKIIGEFFTVVDSSSNNGSHQVDTIVYSSVTGKTTITTKTYHSITPSEYVDVFNNTEYYGSTGSYFGVIVPFLTSKRGDSWKGLYVHWLLDSVEPTVPVNTQNANYLQKTFTYTVPNYGFDIPYYDGLNQDEQYGYDGQSRFTFPVTYMLDTDDIQVYLNGVRQYGTYSESINVDERSRFDAEPYNSSRYDSPRHPRQVLSNSINFNSPLTIGDHVVIKVGAACVDDYQQYVAVVQYNDVFGNTNIGVKNLTQYRLHEQVKTQPNQYILFDVYNVNGTTNYSANELFKYHEDISAPVNDNIGLKLIISRNDFQFNNLLVNDGKLLCYKEYDDGEVLNTVWRKSSVKYIPKKVNKYREPSLIESDTDWELPEPLRRNVTHECRADLSFRELFTHFKGIANSQSFTKNYVTKDRICKLLPKLDYIGGNIKEHNGNFDYLISAMHQDVYSYTSIISFAKNKYAENLHDLTQLSINKIAYYADVNKSLTHELAIQTIADNIVTELTNNLLLDVTYYDSTSYQNNVGIRNWIATLPVLGLYPSYEPMLIVDSKLSLNQVRHHDGHISTTKVSASEFDTFIETFNFDSNINNGNFKYDITTKTLTRCYVNFVRQSQPTTANNGDLWYNTTFSTLMQYSGTSWSQVDESLAWTTFNINDVINACLLIVERKLYEISKQSAVKIDYSAIIGNVQSESSLFIDYMKDRYLTYLKSIGELVLPMEFIDSNTFTWNYLGIDSPVFSNGSPQITILYQRSQNWAAYWWQIYELQYGTPYPHLEPWKLQGYPEKPSQWDNVYAALPNSGMRWKPSMWTNIRSGTVDSSLPYPPKAPPTYSIISVNTTGTTHGSYAPDDLLPPRVSNANLVAIGSLVQFNSPSVVRPSSVSNSPQFGLQGTQERQWRTSIDYAYDVLLALFRLQPIKTIQSTFGNDYVSLNGLIVDKVTENVPSYKNTIFHGTTYDNHTYLVNGVNQWYINALRTDNNKTGIDVFKTLWTSWIPKLAYQTNTVIKEDSILVDNKVFELVTNDYQLHIKRTPGADNQWLHSLRISLYQYGSYSTASNGTKIPTSDDWKFRIDTLIPEGNILQYHGVRTYNINTVNLNTNTFVLDNTLTIPWTVDNNVRINYTGIQFKPTNVYKAVPYVTSNNVSVRNNFSLLVYDQLRSQFVPVDLYDTINCYSYSNTGTTYTFNSISGSITDNTTSIPSNIVLKDYDLKYDLSTNTLMQYRILTGKWVSIAANTFVLPVIHDSIYLYDNEVALIKDTDYTIDLQYKTITLIKHITNLSVLIAIPNGTVIEEQSESFSVSTTKGNVTWNHIHIDDSNSVKSLTAPSIVTGIQGVINFIDGYSSYLQSRGFAFNDYSRPLQDPTGVLLNWQNEIEKFVAKVYSGFNQRYDKAYNLASNTVAIYDYIDLNPFKYEFWIGTDHGIVTNILTGPYKDISTFPIVYDKTGKVIDSVDNLKIYRTDKETHVTYNMDTSNYIGGMNKFVDYYEHVILFNDYTTNNNLVYDSFLGLNNEQLYVAFNKHYETTKRPNIGGGFLTSGTIVDNIESTAKTFSQIYDIRANEFSKHITESRSLLGYNNDPYLNSLTSKSKFLFWHGMIHHKGTNNSALRYANVNTGDNIVLDEMWMYKIDAFGHNEKLREMYINIFPTDVVNNKIMYHLATIPDDNFTAIKNDDVTRWKLLPDIDNTNIFEYNVIGTIRYAINGYANLSTPPNNVIYESLSGFYASLPQLCDDVELYIEKSYDLIISVQYPYNTVQGVSAYNVEIPEYIMGVNMLTVSINGIIIPANEYKEISNTLIYIPKLQQYNKTAKVSVIYGRGKLQRNLHYNVLSNDLVQLTTVVKINSVDVIDVVMKRINTSNTTLKLIDTANNIVVSSSEIYNPAYGLHHKSIDGVNYIRVDDPANYLDVFWGEEHINEKWVDTSNLNYLPYYDSTLFTDVFGKVDVSTQIGSWGKTSIWSKLACYEWVASDVPPFEWADNIGTFNTACNRTYIGTPLTILQKSVRATAYDTFSDWYNEVTTYQHINAFEYTLVNNVLSFNVSLTIDTNYDSFGVYVNGIKNRSYTYSTAIDDTLNTLVLSTITIPNIVPKDKIVLIRFADTPDLTRTPTDTDLTKYQEVYKYNVVSKYDITGTSVSNTYYFWATGQISRTNSTMPLAINFTRSGDKVAPSFGMTNNSVHTGFNLSTVDIERSFVDNTNMYTIVIPGDKIIIKNIDKTITNNDYAVQIIKNAALTVDTKDIDVNMHERYTEWKTLRKNSVQRIPEELWTKITETITERTSSGEHVPAYSRILFDTANGTYTRYGINAGQAIGPKDDILNCIIDLINTDSFNIVPVDKDDFVATYNFNGYNNIIKTMNYIYDNFNAQNINEIFFAVLQVLYANNDKIEGITKTSMVSLDCSLTFKTKV
jgi:hypothetical protein